jgi:hypothetical protein
MDKPPFLFIDLFNKGKKEEGESGRAARYKK